MSDRPCDKCGGTGRLPEPDAHCEATITVGHETIECYAQRTHPGEQHMALTGTCCARCGGMDAHSETCPTPEAISVRDVWRAWEDGADVLTDADGEGHAWYAKHQRAE